jgi:GNAT superfamily N-acetyltransferase
MIPVLISYHPFLLALGVGVLWVPSTSRLIFMFFSNKLSAFDLSNTWYIKCQGRLVAWVTLSRDTKGSLIQVLFVEKTWRRRGLGSALVKRIIQETYPHISLNCSHKLVSFYSRLGFVRYGSNMFGFPYMVYKGLEKR